MYVTTAKDGKTVSDSFELRKQQFVDRHGWNLSVEAARYEIDQYDDGHSDHVGVIDDDGLVLTCRLRAATEGSMLREHFSELWTDAIEAGFIIDGRHEITRFCKAPDAGRTRCAQALKLMRHHLERHQHREQHDGFFAVVYASVARLMRLNGIEVEIVSRTIIDGKPAYLIGIDLGFAASKGPRAVPAPQPVELSAVA